MAAAAKKDTPALKIRLMDRSQTSGVTRILADVFHIANRRAFAGDLALSFASPHSLFFAATINDEVVGTVRCQFRPLTSGGVEHPACYLSCLGVDSAARQHGIGRALTEYAENYFIRHLPQGATGIVYLEDATKKADPASDFYEHMNYKTGSKGPSGNTVMWKKVTGAGPRAAARLRRQP
jgi:ribosomal protein S18 acetylase RimI-like enzyme